MKSSAYPYTHYKNLKKIQYKIRWKGWSPEHDSWEPAENIKAKELIRD